MMDDMEGGGASKESRLAALRDVIAMLQQMEAQEMAGQPEKVEEAPAEMPVDDEELARALAGE